MNWMKEGMNQKMNGKVSTFILKDWQLAVKIVNTVCMYNNGELSVTHSDLKLKRVARMGTQQERAKLITSSDELYTASLSGKRLQCFYCLQIINQLTNYKQTPSGVCLQTCLKTDNPVVLKYYWEMGLYRPKHKQTFSLRKKKKNAPRILLRSTSIIEY